MNKESFHRIIKTAWTNLQRNSYLSLGATGTIALTLILFLGILALQFLSNQVVLSLQDKIDVSVYFKTDAAESQIMQVKSELNGNSLVQDVSYISRDQALADFKNRHKNDEVIQESLSQLGENPLQASLSIKSKDPSQYASIVKAIENSKFKSIVDKINFYENEGVIESIHSLSRNIQNWGLLVTMVIGAIAILVTFNTIRLTIYNQKQEIEIMRLVGASNWYIRGPYLAEGGFYGLFAAGAALLIFYPIMYLVSDKVASFVPSVSLMGYFLGNIGQVTLVTVVLGIFLGVVSSAITISKHLKI